VGLAGVVAAQELYGFGVIGLQGNFPIIAAGSGLIGFWIAMVSLVGGRSLRLSRGLTHIGAGVGVGMLLIPVGAFLLGGLAVMAAPKLVLNNYPFLVTVVIAIIAIAIGLPIWSIWLGRNILFASAL
jgi:hypothetical protein